MIIDCINLYTEKFWHSLLIQPKGFIIENDLNAYITLWGCVKDYIWEFWFCIIHIFLFYKTISVFNIVPSALE